jgi:predicted deacylase
VNSFDWVRAPEEGIFRSRVRVDQQVASGDVIGELVDLVGDPIATIKAPVSGVVLFVVTSPAMKKDGLLLAIGAL